MKAKGKIFFERRVFSISLYYRDTLIDVYAQTITIHACAYFSLRAS